MFHYQKIKILQLSVFAVIISIESDRGLAGSGSKSPYCTVRYASLSTFANGAFASLCLTFGRATCCNTIRAT